MKKLTSLSSALLLGLSAVNAQVTSEIVGYETITIKSGQYNLMGVRLLEDIEFSGADLAYTAPVLDGDENIVTSGVFSSSVDFSSLEADTPYQLEINSGDNEGVVIAVEVNAAGTGLELHDLYATSDIPAFTGAEFKLRKAATLDSVFGADNRYNLTGSANAAISEADEIIVAIGSTLHRHFYSTFPGFTGWFYDNNGSPVAAGDSPILSTTGILIFKKSANDIDIVIEGNVKQSATLFTYEEAYNYVSAVYPAGTTLANSGLSSGFVTSDNFAFSESDQVLMPNGTGGYNRYAYADNSTFTGWYDESFNDVSDTELTSGIIIFKVNGGSSESMISDRTYN